MAAAAPERLPVPMSAYAVQLFTDPVLVDFRFLRIYARQHCPVAGALGGSERGCEQQQGKRNEINMAHGDLLVAWEAAASCSPQCFLRGGFGMRGGRDYGGCNKHGSSGMSAFRGPTIRPISIRTVGDGYESSVARNSERGNRKFARIRVGNFLRSGGVWFLEVSPRVAQVRLQLTCPRSQATAASAASSGATVSSGWIRG